MSLPLATWDRLMDTEEPAPFGYEQTYDLGARWLRGCEVVEDWGCGRRWFEHFLTPRQGYLGVDASPRWADVVTDLRDYRSFGHGVFMRHVLEHNPDWPTILDNLLASFRHRAAVIVYTECSPAGTVFDSWAHDDIPVLRLDPFEMARRISATGVHGTVRVIVNDSRYYGETCWLLWR